MDAVIGPGQFVEIRYTLRDGRGNLVENADEAFGFVVGMGALVPGLEQALEGARPGDTLNVTVPPEDAYGLRDPANIFDVARDEFPDPAAVEVGTEYTAEGDDGTVLTMRVVELHEDYVVVDANHPLAGETLNFQVRVVTVRPPTEEELLAARAELAEGRAVPGEPN